MTRGTRPSPPRWRRRLVRLLRGTLATLLALTLASVVFNLATTPPDTLAPQAGQVVTVDGVRVHYQRWGTTGRPLVFVHGFAESSVAWQLVGPQLARDHTVYAIDLAGSGYTQYTGRYTLADEVALLDGFIRTMKLDDPILIGHSMGAAVVGGVALWHADDVGGVIFADGDALPFGDPDNPRRPPTWITKLPWTISAYRTVTGWSWLGERAIGSQCGSQCLGLTRELSDAWLRPMRQGAAERAIPAMAGAGVLHLTPDQIRSIAVPRGIIWGAEDATSGGSLALAKQYLGQPTTITIAKAGHLSMIADPAAFAAAVRTLERDMRR